MLVLVIEIAFTMPIRHIGVAGDLILSYSLQFFRMLYEESNNRGSVTHIEHLDCTRLFFLFPDYFRHFGSESNDGSLLSIPVSQPPAAPYAQSKQRILKSCGLNVFATHSLLFFLMENCTAERLHTEGTY